MHSLNENGPTQAHIHVHIPAPLLNILEMAWRFGLLREGVSTFENSKLSPGVVSVTVCLFPSLRPEDKDVKLSAASQHQGCLCVAMIPAMMIMDQPSVTVSKPPIRCFPFKSCFGPAVSPQQSNTN